MTSMFSLGVTVNRNLCQMEFAGWRKNHRKSRINKKWHKKYGPLLRCRGHAYRLGAQVVCCPCVERVLRNELA